MTKEGIYYEMAGIKIKKNNAIKKRDEYKTFMNKIDKLLEDLNKGKDSIIKLQTLPIGLNIDSRPADNGKVGELKTNIEATITSVYDIRNEANNRINELNNTISSLENKYRNLNNQYIAMP